MTPSCQAPLNADLTTESRRVCRTPVSYDDPSSSTIAAAAHDLASGAISLPREHLDHSPGTYLTSLVSSISIAAGARRREVVEHTKREYLTTRSRKAPLWEGALQ
jgi:hypothetical protein